MQAKCMSRTSCLGASSRRCITSAPCRFPTAKRSAVLVRAGKVEKVSQEQLEVAIADRSTNLVVDFYATWCGPCVLLASELEKVAEELGEQVKVYKVDVDENPDLASELQIMGLPTLVFIPRLGQKPALRTEGYLPSAQIVSILQEL